jgi:hypothetical protein
LYTTRLTEEFHKQELANPKYVIGATQASWTDLSLLSSRILEMSERERHIA